MLDQQGRLHELRKYGDSKALVLISVASACESSIENLPEYQLLRTAWDRQGIEVFGIAVAPDESLESARLFDELYHSDLPILLDTSQLVAESLGIEKIGEIVVFDPGRQQMLYRGKSMRFSVVYPDGTQDDVLNVPDYNFNWQPTYRLSKPMLLPAGSRVIIEGAFDNSEYNLDNPDPWATVRGGAQSWDEMFIGYFSYFKTH